MTRISELATSFEKQSKRLASDTEQAIQSALQEHEQRLRKVLESSAKKTTDAIQQTEQQHLSRLRRLRRAVVAAWALQLVTLAIGCLALVAGLWWTGGQLASSAERLSQQRQMLSQAAAIGVEIHRTEQGEYLLLPPGTTGQIRQTQSGQQAVIIQR